MLLHHFGTTFRVMKEFDLIPMYQVPAMLCNYVCNLEELEYQEVGNNPYSKISKTVSNKVRKNDVSSQ